MASPLGNTGKAVFLQEFLDLQGGNAPDAARY